MLFITPRKKNKYFISIFVSYLYVLFTDEIFELSIKFSI